MKKVLVIEDDDLVRDMMKTILQRFGYEVYEASDGKMGVSQFREIQTDLVITDIIMPEQEGIETMRQIRKENPDVKIIAISGGGRIEAKDYLYMADKLGADATLAKPFEMKTLVETVRKLIK